MATNDERDRDHEEPEADEALPAAGAGAWTEPTGEPAEDPAEEPSAAAEAAEAPPDPAPPSAAVSKPGKPLQAALWALVLLVVGLGILTVLAHLPPID